VSQKKSPNLASCSFDKHGLILIIFSQHHQHTFSNDMHIWLFLSLYFYLLYLLLNSCNGNDAKQRIFLYRLLVAQKSRLYSVLALQRASFSLADVQSDVILPSYLHVTVFSIDQMLCRWRFVIPMPLCRWGAASSRWSQRLVSRTGFCTMYTRSCIGPQIL